ncbi:glutathione S-transferase U17-like isoform X2 [Phoenix dactylifera]|uniref:Glutathione S-transferase U17-like isoform X2 n=1 Tax=Phoenix dactylifera TaxID=42345 RepID=A0A8B8ZUL0_PHODC|nr:glutathione S-transferase U17-like isoform X2 [Phoenix dactylifera]
MVIVPSPSPPSSSSILTNSGGRSPSCQQILMNELLCASGAILLMTQIHEHRPSVRGQPNKVSSTSYRLFAVFALILFVTIEGLIKKLRPSFGAILRSSAEGQGAAVDNFRQNLEFLEAELRDGFCKGRKFFGGERIGLLDIVMGCGLYWNSASEDVLGLKIIDQESFPFFTSWFESFNEAKEVKEVIPPTEKLVEYVKGLLQKMFN